MLLRTANLCLCTFALLVAQDSLCAESAPVIQGLSQTLAPFYGNLFTLTVNGQNFVSGAQVNLGGVLLSTTFENPTRLTAIVPRLALRVAGSLPVTVTNPDAKVSNKFVFTVVERGDVNGSRNLNIGDALVVARMAGGLINPMPPISVGDVNLSGRVDIGDALAIALFAGRMSTNLPGPSIASVSPAQASPATALTIMGTGFSTDAVDNEVEFTTSTGLARVIPAGSVTKTSITVTVPSNAISGPIRVYRLDIPVGGPEFPLMVTGTTTPVILTSSSLLDRITPGTSIVLSGLGFSPTPSNNTVTFRSVGGGRVTAAVTDASPNSLTVTVPSTACADVNVAAGGKTSSMKSLNVSGNHCGLTLSHLTGGGAPQEILILEGTEFDPAIPANNVVSLPSADGGTVIAPVLQAGGTELQVVIPANASSGGILVTEGASTSNILIYAASSTQPLPPGLVSHWLADGDATDTQGLNHGELRNGAGFTAGRTGMAFNFDGKDDVVRIPASSSLDLASGHSILLWAYRTNSTSPMNLFGKRNGCGANINYYQLSIDSTIPLNTWVHIAEAYDGAEERYYVNGVLAGTAPRVETNNNAELLIGASGACDPFAGRIDEIQLYNRALSTSEIQSAMQYPLLAASHQN